MTTKDGSGAGAWRRLLGKLTLVVASLVVSVLLAEGALRLYYWSQGVGRSNVQELLALSRNQPSTEVDSRSVFGIVQPSPFPDVVYELRGNLQGKFRGQPFSTNSFGLRGPEVERSKAAGTLRIVGLGDSHMFGWGVGQDETYLALLQKAIRERLGTPVEVLNFAAPGYNTAIEAAVFERKARYFEPDLVVLHFVGNDLSLPHHLQPPRTLAPSQWFVVELARSILGAKGSDGELELLPHNLKKISKKERIAARGQYSYMVGEPGYRRAMGRLAEITSEMGVPVLVFYLGNRELAAEASREHGFSTLSATPYFTQHLEQSGLEVTHQVWKKAFKIPKDGHPTALAHRAYAGALEAELVKRGLVPGQ